MPTTHRLCRNNPLIPYAARPGSGPCVLHYPRDIKAAREIIYSISNFDNMVRLCSECHCYITGAPHPDVAHRDVPAGPGCGLPHHPAPCPWVDRNGRPCQHHAAPLPPLPESPPELLLSTSATTSASATPPVTSSEALVGGALFT